MENCGDPILLLMTKMFMKVLVFDYTILFVFEAIILSYFNSLERNITV